MTERCEWLGAVQPSLDRVTVQRVDRAALGVYGGCTEAGAHKNEDAALLWENAEEGWTFAAVLDAHGSAQSARAVLDLLAGEFDAISALLKQAAAPAFAALEAHLLKMLGGSSFQQVCADLSGETALLCVAQRDNFLWWFSVGDCALYLLHPDLMGLGQYALTQRHFFQWIGEVNTFAQACAAYSSGRFMLRPGQNDIVLLTDGVLEFGTRPFEDPAQLAATVYEAESAEGGVRHLLAAVQQGQGRDSFTVVGWRVENSHAAMQPSA
ncbi:protein phosphatase 2C domain-containing protein [Deinococcus radiophilus]|uniref:Protein phosphatase 2C domain-containing protein n=1 Tax=Deinococcus radiophilus TaxID=32062 RepID=A0A3S0L483_9DEIO|nr:protein phosphatase 2C domain-containing protein [Deinococcus radiophilus]RTR26672.1 protein phosphatase 2C domain-containing protein [Deinococcus radiophilus]UFA51000.1 protein phosphatase 2C domain-containing protein [Deinococcus radiophilus]